MTKVEAVLQLQSLKEHCNSFRAVEGIWEDDMQALDAAIDAVQKQIPRKPDKAIDNTWGVAKGANICPVCGYYLGNYAFIPVGKGIGDSNKIVYCETCGQAIDWEEGND